MWFFLVFVLFSDGNYVVAAPTFTTQAECNKAVVDPIWTRDHLQFPPGYVKAFNQWTDFCEQGVVDPDRDAVEKIKPTTHQPKGSI